MAIGFSSLILWWVRCLNEFEVNGNRLVLFVLLRSASASQFFSLERIEQYVTIEQEPKPTEQGKPPAAWPTSGDLRVEGLCARYSLDGPKVLRDLNFHIRSGERVGVVGRTGSGKVRSLIIE
jgi:ABC-type multidrug transport system fused ATPase/permease subunit